MSFSQDEINSLIERSEESQIRARKRNIIAVTIPTVAAVLYLALTGFLIVKAQDKLVQLNKEVDQLNQKKAQLAQLITAQQNLIAEIPQPIVQSAYAANPSIAKKAPLVYIQIRDQSQKKIAQSLSNTLTKEGFIVPGLDQVNTGPNNRTQVRYFRPQDKEIADSLVKTLQTSGIQGQVVSQLTKPSKANQKHFEIWFSPNVH
ncbi:hypothetical protein [Pantanalinema sp. GBBB05]|uniref:hypothetical protein n=1 Tax=Pantanalinema sp. GBBB05 TaxID=2604139 RepID=UPI001DBC9474|nr:hypothetical protein [Pantanalinema sp. GBBB05]